MSVFVPWIHHFCARNPEVIQLDFHSFNFDRFYEVPATVFETQSLAQLRFTGLFKVPDHTKLLIDLPNLKSLQLNVGDSNLSLIATLFKGFPLLEDLRLFMCSWEEQEPYFVKSLLICIKQDYHSPSFCNHKFVIDAPMLEYCDLSGDLVFCDFIKSSSNLHEVRISSPYLVNSGKNDNYRTKVLQLFPGICWVKSLIVTQWDGTLLCMLSELDSIGTPTFRNLVSLDIEVNGNDKREWEQLPCFPLCFLANLKQLKTKDLMGCNPQLEMLQHILYNAPVLEQLYVSIGDYDRNHIQVQLEYDFCRKLFMLPKSSKSCEIEFSGLAIKTSSKDFSNGVLNCQIIDHEIF